MLQYSLRSLLVVMLVASLLCGILFALPAEWGLFTLYSLVALAPGAALCGAIYMQGYHRAFFFGAAPLAVVSGPVTLLTIFGGTMVPIYAGSSTSELEAMWMMKLMALLPLVLIFASGIVGVLMRLWAVWLAGGMDRKPAAPSNSGIDCRGQHAE